MENSTPTPQDLENNNSRSQISPTIEHPPSPKLEFLSKSEVKGGRSQKSVSPKTLVAQFSQILENQKNQNNNNSSASMPELIDYKQLYLSVRQQLDDSALRYEEELKKRDQIIHVLTDRNQKLENQLQTSNLTMEILSKLQNTTNEIQPDATQGQSETHESKSKDTQEQMTKNFQSSSRINVLENLLKNNGQSSFSIQNLSQSQDTNLAQVAQISPKSSQILTLNNQTPATIAIPIQQVAVLTPNVQTIELGNFSSLQNLSMIKLESPQQIQTSNRQTPTLQSSKFHLPSLANRSPSPRNLSESPLEEPEQQTGPFGGKLREKRHKCEWAGCDKAFYRGDELKRHMRVHTKIKPFPCPYCERHFSRSDHLRSHIRIHTGDKPYKCNYCEKAFARSDERLRHHRVHEKNLAKNDPSFLTDILQNLKKKEGEKLETQAGPQITATEFSGTQITGSNLINLANFSDLENSVKQETNEEEVDSSLPILQTS